MYRQYSLSVLYEEVRWLTLMSDIYVYLAELGWL